MLTAEHFAELIKPQIATVSVNRYIEQDKVKFIINNLDFIKGEMISGHHCTKADALSNQLSILGKKKKDIGVMKLRAYDNTTYHGYGRVKPVGKDVSYVQITRPVRQFLVREWCSDLDIKNAHPEIAAHLYEMLTNNPLTELQHWNQHREQFFETLKACSAKSIDRDACKALAFVFLYDGDVTSAFEKLGFRVSKILPNHPVPVPDDDRVRHIFDLVYNLHHQFCQIAQLIEKRYPELWDALPSQKSGTSRETASKLSVLFQHIERRVVVDVIRPVAVDMGYIVHDICHDGLLISDDYKPLTDEQAVNLCAAADKAVVDKFGLSLHSIIKPMDHPFADRLDNWMLTGINKEPSNLTVPDTDYLCAKSFMSIIDRHVADDGSISSSKKELAAKKEYFERHACYISSLSRVAFRTSPNEWVLLSENNAKRMFCSNLIYISPALGGIPCPFFTYWLSLTDRRQMHTIGWYPSTINPADPPCPVDTLNTFCGFLHPVDPDFKVNNKLIDPWLYHLKSVWANDDDAVYQYLLDWFAYIVQFCKKTGICIMIKSSRQGAGKNVVADFFARHVIGIANVWQCSDMDRLLGNFNAQVERNLFTVLDEIEGKGAAYKNANRLKDIITRVTVPIERKGVDSYTGIDRSNYLITTNTDWGAKIDPSDRRYLCIEASNIKAGNSSYFNDLVAASTPTIGLHFFHFLLRRKISRVITDMPMTSFKRTLQDRNEDPYLKTLRVLRSRIVDEVGYITSKELLELYNSFCQKGSCRPIVSVQQMNATWKAHMPEWESSYVAYKSSGKGCKLPGGFNYDIALILSSIRSIRRDPDWDFETVDDDPDDIITDRLV